MGSFPQIGMKTTHIWNHGLVLLGIIGDTEKTRFFMAYDTPKVNMASISSQQITEVKRSLLIRNMGVSRACGFSSFEGPPSFRDRRRCNHPIRLRGGLDSMGVALGWDFGVSYKHVIRVMLAARVSRCWVLLGSKAKGPRWVKNQPQPGSSNFNTPEKNQRSATSWECLFKKMATNS